MAVARSAYERVGGFDVGLPHANDWEMWCRLAATGPVAVVEGVHASYRHHPGSDTNRLRGSMTYLEDPVAALEVILDGDDPAEARALRHHVHRSLARDARWVAGLQRDAGQHRLALRSALAAARLDPRPGSVGPAVGEALRTLRHRIGPLGLTEGVGPPGSGRG